MKFKQMINEWLCLALIFHIPVLSSFVVAVSTMGRQFYLSARISSVPDSDSIWRAYLMFVFQQICFNPFSVLVQHFMQQDICSICNAYKVKTILFSLPRCVNRDYITVVLCFVNLIDR